MSALEAPAHVQPDRERVRHSSASHRRSGQQERDLNGLRRTVRHGQCCLCRIPVCREGRRHERVSRQDMRRACLYPALTPQIRRVRYIGYYGTAPHQPPFALTVFVIASRLRRGDPGVISTVLVASGSPRRCTPRDDSVLAEGLEQMAVGISSHLPAAPQ